MFHESAELYDTLYSWKDYGGEAERLHELIRRHRGRVGGRLLDVACGTASHIAHLRDRYRCEGLDLDPAILRVARRKNPGLRFHEGDMVDFGLGREFDVVTCLFSSIGYVRTLSRLRKAVRTMGRHVAPGGLLLVEPWFSREELDPGRVHASIVDEPELKVTRMSVTFVRRKITVLDFHYLVATPRGVEHFVERHELGLFTREQYLDAFRRAGLEVSYDARGLMDRGLYIGRRPAAPES
jgi:SAM-dependent methyltransferase